jgi:hypothetical protein
MAQTTFDGPVRSLNGFIGTGPGTVKNITAASTTLDVANYAGRLIRVNNSTAEIILPAIIATAYPASSGPSGDYNSTNNIGTSYKFYIETSATSGGLTIKTDGTDKFVGIANIVINNDAGGKSFDPSAADDIITLNGTTKGGVSGSTLEITAVAANKYLVTATLLGSGVLVTPFSA